MDFLRRNWTQIQAQIGDWSFSTKWLIASLLTIMLLVGSIFVWVAGAPDLVPVGALAEGGNGEVMAHLEADGLDPVIKDGQVYVPVAQQFQATAILTSQGVIRSDAYKVFDDVFKAGSNSWKRYRTSSLTVI